MPGEDPHFIKKVHKICIKCAYKAGHYLMKMYQKGDLKINAHSQHDVKLDVDVKTEHLIKSTIKAYFPDHGFICEESGQERTVSDCNWVIDPLDGTVNFSKGIPHFCTSIALKKKDTYLVGVVYDPVKREIFSGVRGVGATLNNIPIERKNIGSLEEAVIAGGFFKAGSLTNGSRIFEKIAYKVKKLRFFGSAALDLCYLACGRVNAYIQHSVNEWDIAAASLIAELTGVRLVIEKTGSNLNVFGADKNIFESLKLIMGEFI
jgi:myo-inositol-1(or 4)-monophosphatase